jgi:hypothetical protein
LQATDNAHVDKFDGPVVFQSSRVARFMLPTWLYLILQFFKYSARRRTRRSGRVAAHILSFGDCFNDNDNSNKWPTRRLPSLRLPSALALLLLLPERADAGALFCDKPDVPCEMPLVESCLDLLTQGVVKTTDLLRDDDETDGCIVCAPPGGSYTGPMPCPTCECIDGEAVCFSLGAIYLAADQGTGECPPSDYANVTNFTVMTPACPMEEGLDCGGGGDAPMPTCNGESGVPCEIPFASSCIDLLTTGELDISDILRDDESTGGCILCIPPGGFYEGPETCPTCECNGSEIECSAIGKALMFVSNDAGECPPSE